MTPVLQQNMSLPGGDCFAACIASILDLPLSSVPNFMHDSKGYWTQTHWDDLKRWCAPRGIQPIWVDPEIEMDLVLKLESTGVYYIATGPSQAGIQWGHCVVMRAGDNVHDPVGTGEFLAGDPWLYIAFQEARIEHAEESEMLLKSANGK